MEKFIHSEAFQGEQGWLLTWSASGLREPAKETGLEFFWWLDGGVPIFRLYLCGLNLHQK